jgi:hypothetical protein
MRHETALPRCVRKFFRKRTRSVPCAAMSAWDQCHTVIAEQHFWNGKLIWISQFITYIPAQHTCCSSLTTFYYRLFNSVDPTESFSIIVTIRVAELVHLVKCLFNDDGIGYTVSNEKMAMNWKLGRMWKRSCHFSAITLPFPGGSKANHEKVQS